MSMSALSADVPICLVCLSEARSLIPEFCHEAESLLAVRGGWERDVPRKHIRTIILYLIYSEF
jgi:hypothetical protein